MIAIVLIATVLAADDAVTQVARTLDNLLASIEDENRVEETAFSARQQWCKEAQSQGSNRLASFQDQEAQAQADVAEVTAAADEIAAAAQTMRHQLNQSKGTQQRSLDEQLASELPLLSSKRTAATELTRKSVDLRHVVSAEQAALAAVTQSCDASAKQHQLQSEARMSAHSLLEHAKELLGQAPSFLQVEQAQVVAQRVVQQQSQRAAAKLAKLQASPEDPLAKAQGHLQHLLKALEVPAEDSTSVCDKELKSNKLALVWKQDELSRLAADTKAHSQAVDEATAELADVGAAISELQQHTDVLAAQQTQDADALSKREKDHMLLAKVVAQAVTVLREAGAPVAEAAKALEDVGSLLQKQGAEMQKAQLDLAPRADRAQRSVTGALKAVSLEKEHLELAQSQHRVALAEMRQQTDAATEELGKVQAYVVELGKSCTPNADEAARKRKEVETVEDAMRSIGGDAPVRVIAPPAAAAGDMSPLQRAAYEMGVASQA